MATFPILPQQNLHGLEPYTTKPNLYPSIVSFTHQTWTKCWEIVDIASIVLQ